MKYHARRPEVWVLAAAVACAIGSVLMLRNHAWLGDPLWGQETIGIAQVIALPLVAAASAVWAARDRASFFTFLPRGHQQLRHALWSLAAWAAPLALVYVLANLAVMALSSAADTALSNAQLLPVLTQILGMLLAVCVGYAIGFYVPSWTAALISAAVVAATLILDRMGSIPTGFAEYTASGSMIGARVDVAYFLERMMWLIVLSGALVAAVLVRPTARRVPLAVLSAVLLAGGFLFSTNDSYALAAANANYCSGDAPVVCGPKELRARVDEAAAMADKAAQTLRSLGVTAPQRLVAWEPATDQRDWVMLLNTSRFRDPLDPREVVSAVVSPKSCALWRSAEPPPDKWFAADRLVRSYVATQARMPAGGDYEAVQKRLGPTHAQQLLKSSAQGLQTCNADLIPVEMAG